VHPTAVPIVYPNVPTNNAGRTISGHRLALAMAAAVAGPPILAFDATNN